MQVKLHSTLQTQRQFKLTYSRLKSAKEHPKIVGQQVAESLMQEVQIDIVYGFNLV